MSYYTPFYSTLNALEYENCAKRANVIAQRQTIRKPLLIQSKLSHNLTQIYDNPQKKLRDSRIKNEKIERQNTLTRQKINYELMKSQKKAYEIQKMKRIEMQTQAQLVERKYKDKLQKPYISLVQSAFTRTAYMQQMSASMKRPYYNPTP